MLLNKKTYLTSWFGWSIFWAVIAILSSIAMSDFKMLALGLVVGQLVAPVCALMFIGEIPSGLFIKHRHPLLIWGGAHVLFALLIFLVGLLLGIPNGNLTA